jgi:hypothetical protein
LEEKTNKLEETRKIYNDIIDLYKSYVSIEMYKDIVKRYEELLADKKECKCEENKNCYNCKYGQIGLYDRPCINCNQNHSKWESKC